MAEIAVEANDQGMAGRRVWLRNPHALGRPFYWIDVSVTVSPTEDGFRITYGYNSPYHYNPPSGCGSSVVLTLPAVRARRADGPHEAQERASQLLASLVRLARVALARLADRIGVDAAKVAAIASMSIE